MPSFPSLYWPFPVSGDQARYLYAASDIWRFTLYWTFIMYAAVHGAASAYAICVQWRSWKIILWLVPITYMLVGELRRLLRGAWSEDCMWP